MAGFAGGWLVAARLARRELRGGVRGFRIFLACLGLGVAAIAGVGSLAAGLVAGLAADGRALLGGDVELRLIHRPASDAERAWLAARGRLGTVVTMRGMAYAGAARSLIEIKAVDGGYPLFGAVELSPPAPLERLLAERDGIFGAVVEPLLLRRLGIAVGDRISVGEASFEIRGLLEREPDRATEGLVLGPRVLIAAPALERTGLVTLGSLISYHYRLALPAGTEVDAFAAEVKRDHADAGWRLRDWRNGSPGLRQFIDRLGLFLVLVGLTALLVGGVGVGNAVASYLDAKTATIATLKCLGAPGALIFRVYLLQVAALALGGIGLGLVAGAALPAALVGLFGELLPVPLKAGVYPAPLALAALYGLLVGLAFALWPLARAREVAPAGLFRDLVAPARRWPRPHYVAATALLFAALAAIAVVTTDERRFALGFVAGAAASFLLLAGAARGLMALARRLGRPRVAALRVALANLHRPGAATVSVVLSLGLGLALLVAIALIQGNLVRQVAERLPGEAPAFFFIDIQPDQAAEFERVARTVPGVGAVERVPALRGRITRVAGVPADEAPVSPDRRWVLRGDRALTYAARLPRGTRIVEGEWWPGDYAGPPLVSLEREAAAGLGLKLGDSIAVNVLGREVEARIASLRQVDWGTLGLNFVLIFAPGTLEAAPHSFIATVKASGAAEDAVWRAVTDRFPNVTAIRMKEVLEQVDDILGRIGIAVRAAASVTLAAGVLVLAGAIVSGHRRRVREAVILKVLGATRADVLKALVAEYALLGLVAAAIAALVGWLAAWIVVAKVMGADWVALPGTVALAALGGVAVTVALGLAGTWRALSQKPAPILRRL
jgi:putative ABC transport system permease protein